MRSLLLRLAIGYVLTLSLLSAADAPIRSQPVPIQPTPIRPSHLTYYWKAAPAGDTAQMLTLFCRNCGPNTVPEATADLPLVSVLRDTLGDGDRLNDRILYVWLLRYTRPTVKQRVLSGIPFFYWKVGDSTRHSAESGDVPPLLDLTAPQHLVFENLAKNIFQWAALDPMTMSIRASSRAYRANSFDNERWHIEEAVTYLRNAPASNSPQEITPEQLQTMIARLELRSQTLGGLVTRRAISGFEEQVESELYRIRARNWELLRQCAEKTGLYFDPLSVGATRDKYAMLWYPVGSSLPQGGVDVRPLWKLLNIRDPRKVKRAAQLNDGLPTRWLDWDGSKTQLIPLGVYSLSYPKLPLLLIDFQDELHIRRREIIQRSINEITAGVIGVSHITNWYYYVAADVYNFVVSRHGKATDENARLDCYAQFRADLFHDRTLDADFKTSLQQRMNMLEINPLGVSPEREMDLAQERYSALVQPNGEVNRPLTKRLDRNRRAELATYSESLRVQIEQSLLHVASLGIYTRLAPTDEGNLASLDRYRRAQAQVDFLDALVAAGTQPEVSYGSDRIQASIADLGRLLPDISSKEMRAHVSVTLAGVQTLSSDSGVRRDCTVALASMDKNRERINSPVNAETAVSGAAFSADSFASVPLHRTPDPVSSPR